MLGSGPVQADPDPVDPYKQERAVLRRLPSALPWTATERRLLAILDLRLGPLPTPLSTLIEKLYQQRWGRLSPRRRARLLGRLRSLRCRMNEKLRSANSPVRVVAVGRGEDPAVYLQFQRVRTPTPAQPPSSPPSTSAAHSDSSPSTMRRRFRRYGARLGGFSA
jgi:hypothetical protein